MAIIPRKEYSYKDQRQLNRERKQIQGERRKRLEKAAPALLAACKATWNYWLACAESAQKYGDVGTSPNVHAAEDEPHLSELANKAAKMTKFAIEQAGESGE